MPQALTGSRKSIPKLVRVNADDSRALLYRNLGNGRRLPLLWATTVSLVSGTSQQTVVASAIEFHGFNIGQAKVEITPVVSGTSATTFPDPNILGKVYVVKDATNQQIIIKSTAEIIPDATCNFDVYIYFGTSTEFNSADSNQIWKR